MTVLISKDKPHSNVLVSKEIPSRIKHTIKYVSGDSTDKVRFGKKYVNIPPTRPLYVR